MIKFCCFYLEKCTFFSARFYFLHWCNCCSQQSCSAEDAILEKPSDVKIAARINQYWHSFFCQPVVSRKFIKCFVTYRWEKLIFIDALYYTYLCTIKYIIYMYIYINRNVSLRLTPNQVNLFSTFMCAYISILNMPIRV